MTLGGGWLWVGGDGSATAVKTGGMLQLKSSHPLPHPLQRKPRQQIIQLQLRRLPPPRIASTISGASSVSRSTRLT